MTRTGHEDPEATFTGRIHRLMRSEALSFAEATQRVAREDGALYTAAQKVAQHRADAGVTPTHLRQSAPEQPDGPPALRELREVEAELTQRASEAGLSLVDFCKRNPNDALLRTYNEMGRRGIRRTAAERNLGIGS